MQKLFVRRNLIFLSVCILLLFYLHIVIIANVWSHNCYYVFMLLFSVLDVYFNDLFIVAPINWNNCIHPVIVCYSMTSLYCYKIYMMTSVGIVYNGNV